MTQEAATTHSPSMDPAEGAMAPSTPNQDAIDVDYEVSTPGDQRQLQPVASSAVAVQSSREGAMSPAQYRQLADRLMLDQRAWEMYFDRCRCIAAAGMYGHKQPETVAVAGLKGMSMGMSQMEALSRIKVIHGQPVIRGSAAINHIHERCGGAKCRCITGLIGSGAAIGIEGFDLDRLTERLRNRYAEYWTEDGLGLDPSQISVWVMARPGWAPKAFIYTWAQAETAGLPGKNQNYKKYPARCLKWQAASEGAQEMFGDVLDGLYFDVELENDRDGGTQSGQGSARGNYQPTRPRSEPPPAAKPSPHQQPAPQPDQAPAAKSKPEPEPEPTPPPAADQETKAPVQTDEHPKVTEVTRLLDALAAKANQPGTDEYVAARKAIYREAVQTVLGRDLGGKAPTLPQLDKLITHLKELV